MKRKLKESYFDSLQYKISRYEELVSDAFTDAKQSNKEGHVNPAEYLDALKRIYDIIEALPVTTFNREYIDKFNEIIHDEELDQDVRDYAIDRTTYLVRQYGGVASDVSVLPDGVLKKLIDDIEKKASTIKEAINTNCSQFTLEYLGKNGDIVARDYFDEKEEAIEFAKHLIEIYTTYGSENVFGLCITDCDDKEVYNVEI